MSSFADLLQTRRVIVFIGAGGVGKTTSSLCAAIAAAQLGRRVALLSIDPAKRLADALGIPLGSSLREIQLPLSSTSGGTLHAAMLDQKVVFDRMVREHAPSDTVAEKILKDPLYKAASTNLAGPLEYMALARLRELAEDPSFDLVVLDTPPDTHALDFLARPNLLQGFMDNKVLSWLIKPFLFASNLGLGKFVSVGERLMGGMARVTGVAALKKFGEFLVLMQEVIEGFHKAGERVVEILKSEQTGFVLVTVPTTAATRSARFLAQQLKAMGYTLSGLVFNRCLSNAVASTVPVEAVSWQRGADLLRARVNGEKSVETSLKKDIAADPIVIRIADQQHDLHELKALLAFSDVFVKNPLL